MYAITPKALLDALIKRYPEAVSLQDPPSTEVSLTRDQDGWILSWDSETLIADQGSLLVNHTLTLSTKLILSIIQDSLAVSLSPDGDLIPTLVGIDAPLTAKINFRSEV